MRVKKIFSGKQSLRNVTSDAFLGHNRRTGTGSTKTRDKPRSRKKWEPGNLVFITRERRSPNDGEWRIPDDKDSKSLEDNQFILEQA